MDQSDWKLTGRHWIHHFLSELTFALILLRLLHIHEGADESGLDSDVFYSSCPRCVKALIDLSRISFEFEKTVSSYITYS